MKMLTFGLYRWKLHLALNCSLKVDTITPNDTAIWIFCITYTKIFKLKRYRYTPPSLLSLSRVCFILFSLGCYLTFHAILTPLFMNRIVPLLKFVHTECNFQQKFFLLFGGLCTLWANCWARRQMRRCWEAVYIASHKSIPGVSRQSPKVACRAWRGRSLVP